MADRPKKSEQGEVNEPEELAAESSVGEQETPTERQLEREQAIVDEPVAESEQRIAEANAPSGPEASPADESAPAEPPSVAAVEDEDEDDDEPETPRVKPEIPGMDLEPDIVLEGEEGLDEDEDGDEDGTSDADEDAFAQPIADAAIDLGAGARYRATGKRKTAVARVILKPGTGAYVI